MLKPPINGVGLKWNFLLLSGISMRNLFDLATFLKYPVNTTEDKKNLKIKRDC